MARNALGKGLGALMGGASTPALASPKPVLERGESVQDLPVSSIIPSPLQPRRVFVPEQLEELSASIRELGVIQPLIVRQVGEKYELIAGERRWRASQAAGRTTVPVIVRGATDLDVLEMALVENLQRADLNPIEESEGYARLMEKFQQTQEQVAEKVGKSRAAVANALRLRNLVDEARDLLSHGQISTGHAKALLSLESREAQAAAAREVVKRGLSVRATEKFVQQMLKPSGKKGGKKSAGGAADWRDIELQLQRRLGTKVRLVGTSDKGRIEIEYYNGADLDRVLAHLGLNFD